MNDFLVDADGNLIIENGDFKTGNADDQNIRAILSSTQGTFIASPLLGVGLLDQVNGNVDQSVKRKIKLHAAADGYQIKKISYQQGELNIKYVRKNKG